MRCLVLVLLFILFALPVCAATFTVTNCATVATQMGSLSWAVAAANGLAEPSLIEFNIPTIEAGYITSEVIGVAFWRISPEALDLNQDFMQIRGSTQTSNQGDKNPYGPEIEITGINLTPGQTLIKIDGNNNCTLEGMIIKSSKSHGLSITLGNNHHIYDCYIGADATGEAPAVANSGAGIYIERSNGNLIEKNVISGNGQYGLEINNSTYVFILNNYIGTDRTGTREVKNWSSGIYLHSGAHHQYVAGHNVIAFNRDAGIWADGGTTNYNTFTQNSFSSNEGVGIALSNWANQGLLAPNIATAEYYSSLGVLFLQGSAPPSSIIEIMKVETPDLYGGEGKNSLGYAQADSAGNWLAYLSTNEVISGDRVTALATDQLGNTSQFGANQTAVAGTSLYQPDGMIGTQSDGSDYIGENVLNTTGEQQTKNRSILFGQSATYYIKLKNMGNADRFIISQESSSQHMEVRYYDSKAGGQDITSQVAGEGYLTPNLSAGASLEIRCETISYFWVNLLTEEVSVALIAHSNPTRKDVVKAITTAAPPEAMDQYSFEVQAPASAEANKPFNLIITAKNTAGETTTEVAGRTILSVDQGTISLTSLEAYEFTDDGIWEGSVSLSKVGEITIMVSNTYLTRTYHTHINILIPGEIVAGGLMRFGPNPYNPVGGQKAVFWYWLNDDKQTSIFVFDAQGGLIWRQVYPAGSMGGQSGVNAVVWDGKNNFGEVLENGVYLYRVAQGPRSLYKGKLIILR